MKKVKIFLASSIEDLREDRLQVGDFFGKLNNIYLDSGVQFILIRCEDYDKSIAAGGKQQQYDREIRESELVFFLFFRKVGDYTRHEFEVALEAFKDREKPKIITYFKYINSIDEATQEVRDFMQMLDLQLQHYYNTYGHIDTLKLGILMQIKLLKLDDAQIKLEDGEVCLNGQPVVKAENVPLLHGNRALRELTEKRQQLQAALDRCRSDYLADPSEENEAAFFNTSAERNRVSEELKKVEQETMALLTTVAEMTSDGRVLTHRLKEALKYFNQGDYTAVLTILEDEERENELRRAELRADVAKNEIRGHVEEELLTIQTKKAQGLTEERVEEILKSYRKVAELVEKHDLNKAALYDYASFLETQNRFSEAISVAEKLNWYYANPSIRVNEEQKAKLYNLLGILYNEIRHFGAAEDAFGKAMEIYTRLAVLDPESYEPGLAMNCQNMGALYHNTRRYEKAEDVYGKAFEIRTRLATRNPMAYEPGLAMNCLNLGNLYQNTRRYGKAEEAYGKAVEILTRLVKRNPEAYEPKLALSCNNLGVLYKNTLRYAKAEEAYGKAAEIYARLAARNPEAYEPDLAMNCGNLGNLYKKTRRYGEAKEAHCKAVEIYTRLAARNPEAYEPDLAMNCGNLGNLYRNTRRYGEAEEAHCKAVEIYTRLAARNPETYGPDLARSLYSMGHLYRITKRYGEAEEAYGKAMEIYARLVNQNPKIYGPDLAVSCNSMGHLYRNTRRYGEAEEAYSKAMEIYTHLVNQNLDVYEPYLADTIWNLFELHKMQNHTEELDALCRKAQPLFEKLAQKDPENYQERAEIIRDILSQA